MDRYVPYIASFYSNCFPTTITNPITHTFIECFYLCLSALTFMHTQSATSGPPFHSILCLKLLWQVDWRSQELIHSTTWAKAAKIQPDMMKMVLRRTKPVKKEWILALMQRTRPLYLQFQRVPHIRANICASEWTWPAVITYLSDPLVKDTNKKIWTTWTNKGKKWMLGQGHFFFSLKKMSASTLCVSARCRQGEKQMACAYVVCTVKHGGGGVMGLVTLLAIIHISRQYIPSWLPQHPAGKHPPIWFMCNSRFLYILYMR